jgi:ATP-binding cassette subfamily C protein CydC
MVANPLSEHGRRSGDLVSRLTVEVDRLDRTFPAALGPLLTAALVGALVTTLLFLFLPSAGPLYALLYAAALFLVPTGLVLLGRSLGWMSVGTPARLRVTALRGTAGHADPMMPGAAAGQRACLAAAARRLDDARRRRAWIGAAGAAAIQILAALAVLAVLWQGLEALGAGTVSGPVLAGLLLACLGSFAALAVPLRNVARLD